RSTIRMDHFWSGSTSLSGLVKDFDCGFSRSAGCLPLALPRRSFRAVQSFACSYFCVQVYALE
ncbi:hypothetical protein, partial [Limosilactobacillus fermentum]|uniref:hypothetical protein n=1 Tax=Limosilactobacillus fermentum TaxID=1613 RepID=UPI0021A48BFE